jgi:uncharacterized membrane protein SirB2
MFSLLKLLHVCCAMLSVSGFGLRVYWMLTANPLLQHRLSKVLPHCIDTVLLGSAAGMLWLWRLSPLDSAWISAKLLALLVYIGLGMVALRFGKNQQQRAAAGLGALAVAAYIISVAYTKSAAGLFGPL